MRFGTSLVKITCVFCCPNPVVLYTDFASMQRIYDIKMSLAAKYCAVQAHYIYICIYGEIVEKALKAQKIDKNVSNKNSGVQQSRLQFPSAPSYTNNY